MELLTWICTLVYVLGFVGASYLITSAIYLLHNSAAIETKRSFLENFCSVLERYFLIFSFCFRVWNVLENALLSFPIAFPRHEQKFELIKLFSLFFDVGAQCIALAFCWNEKFLKNAEIAQL